MKNYYLINKKIKKQNFKKPVAIFSDFDDTYILKYWPSEKTLIKKPQRKTDVLLFNNQKKYLYSFKLKKVLNELNIPLIIISGRDYLQMMDFKNFFCKRYPQLELIMDFDGIISALGTEIYLKTTKNKYVKDIKYEQIIKKMGFKRNLIKKIIIDLISKKRIKNKFQYINLSKRDLENSKEELPPVKNKLSLEFISNQKTANEFLKILDQLFSKEKINNIKILLSSPYKISKEIRKFNIDIAPVSKDFSINYLKKRFHLKTIVCGDSGNDFEMLLKSGDFKIIPGNAKPELLNKIKMLPVKKNFFIAEKKFEGPKAIINFLEKYYENING